MRNNMSSKLFNYSVLILLGLLPAFFSSCIKDNEDVANAKKYAEWKAQNDAYVENQAALTEGDGTPYYTRITPSWAPEAWSLVKWHNDRSLTADSPTPLDNSTVEFKYELSDINGNIIQNSYSEKDSVYSAKVNSNIIGVWAPLTYMHPGDSVTIVIPYTAGYGTRSYGNILPFSTLIYKLKLKSISKYEI